MHFEWYGNLALVIFVILAFYFQIKQWGKALKETNIKKQWDKSSGIYEYFAEMFDTRKKWGIWVPILLIIIIFISRK